LQADKTPSAAALSSVLISALSAGFTTAILSFDFDVNPVNRLQEPGFYGYIPDEALSRTLIFVITMLNSALLLLLRCFTAAVLIRIDVRYFIWYSAGDVGLVFLLKIARNDLWWWPPLYGVPGMLVSVAGRFATKVVADYSGFVQLRGGPELGGICFSLSMVTGLIAPFLILKMYYARTHQEEEEEEEKEDDLIMKESNAWLVVYVLVGAWLLTFCAFLKLMKPKYRRTFLSTQTGNQWSHMLFSEGKDDITKLDIVRRNRHLWESIRPQVRVFARDNWTKWEDERPDWFNDVLISSFDDDLLPPDVLRRLRTEGGGSRMRLSVGERLARTESIRMSMRKRSIATIVPIRGGVGEEEEKEADAEAGSAESYGGGGGEN
jgi:hypothetical protein